VTDSEKCEKCGGTGIIYIGKVVPAAATCDECRGTGERQF
jgi:DnaJ-class molecular chaperone